MTKSKIFMTAGSLVLAISAVFATKASKKFASFATASLTSGNYKVICQYTPGNDIFTTGTGGVSNAIQFAVYTTSPTSGVLVSGNLEANSHNVKIR